MYICPVKDQDPEAYHQINFLLFLPWRVENKVASNYLTYSDCFNELNDEQRNIILHSAKKYNKEDIHHLIDLIEKVKAENVVSLGLQADKQNRSNQLKPSTTLSDVEFFKPLSLKDHVPDGMAVHDQ